MKEIVEDIAAVIVQEQMSSGGGFGGFSDALSSGETTSAFTIPETRTLFATKYYYYNDDGNVTRVVTNLADTFGVPTTVYSADRMAYAFNQQTVTYAIGETWTWDGLQASPKDNSTGSTAGVLQDVARKWRTERYPGPSR